MELLNQFSNLNPQQTQGLLAAAAQMLQQSGPSLRPTSFGQALGGGLMAYQGSMADAQRRKQEEEQARQMAEMRQLQMQDMQGGLEDRTRARQQQQSIAEAARNAFRTPEQMAVSLPGGPTIANAAQIPNMQAGFDQDSFIDQVMRIDPIQGLALKQQFKKQGPKFDAGISWVNGPDGKPMAVRTAEDGSIKTLDGLSPRDKLELAHLGGHDVAYNPFGLQPGQTFKRSQTPDSIASTASAAAGRAQAERHFQAGMNVPQYMETSGGLVALPKKLAPGQAPTGQMVTDGSGKVLEKRHELPQYVVAGVTGNAKSLSVINSALASLDTDAGKNAVGMKGYLPNFALNRLDPEGTATRADIADIGSLTIHDRSGAAVTAAESPRLMPFIPLPTDDAKTVKTKLTRFKQALEAETNNLTFQFPQAKKLADYSARDQPAAKADAPPDIADLLNKYGGK